MSGAPAPIRCIAIANRGEAALRCLRTAKMLRAREGAPLDVLALYTDPDRHAPFVRHADRAIELPAPRGALAAHLDRDAVLDAALRGGADAIWPGWGFLAEDPVFADRVEAAGLRFLGPPGEVMRRLGDKVEAKRLAERLGVPVAPWSGEALGSLEAARKAAAQLGLPLLVKAAAGGGGRGIRVVRERGELEHAFRSAADEATSAFGDGRVFLERRVEGARHVEIQIAADAHGGVLALGARECSVQRRHQKLIEEAPPPGLAAARVAALEAAAVALARAVEYRGVGTVEFLVDAGGFYFLEVNPRLQVEHGITEEVSGVDLVEWQIRIARGERLPAAAPAPRGAAIEARVCAEDPSESFRPAPGRVARFDAPLGPGVRIDAGVVAGSVVPADFDSLVAKVIARGADRDEARARLVAALRDLELVIEGGASNRAFLLELLESEELRAGAVDTSWLERRSSPSLGADDGRGAAALVAAAILAYQRERAAARRNFYAGASQVALARVPLSLGRAIDLVHAGASLRVEVRALGGWRYRIAQGDAVASALWSEEGAHAARLEIGGRRLRVLHDVGEAGARVDVEGAVAWFAWSGAGQVRAPAPAVVVALAVAPGDAVAAGDPLGVLEAMKSEVAFHAPVAGVVRELRVRRGQQVAAGDVLLVIDESESAPAPASRSALRVHAEPDPIASLAPEDGTAAPAAIDAARAEIRAIAIGYDHEPARAERIAAWLEAPLPDATGRAELAALAALCSELAVFTDVESLFARSAGSGEPSSAARMRAFVRRMPAQGAGIAESFLHALRRALAHHGVASLAHGDASERAVLRLFATQRATAIRHRVASALLRRTASLARRGVTFEDPAALRDALGTLASLRGLVSDALADAAIETRALVFEEPTPSAAPAAFAPALDLSRLVGFELTLLHGAPGLAAYHARHREVPDDERIFVLAEIGAGEEATDPDADRWIPAFEQTFYAATRRLRAILVERDPGRRLLWNRIFLRVRPPIRLRPATAEALARRLAPATSHLGLEKVIVQLALLGDDAAPPTPLEIVIEDPTGARLDVTWRQPRREPLRAARDYERRVVAARRRRVVYPYEIVRMLTTPGGDLPAGRFAEWDLDADGRAVCVDGREWGRNASAIVFGVIETPTRAVPEGVRRVLVLSDPTRDMGALAAAECDRVVAALDLAAALGVPVEWVPLSSGARIAMQSGTENLDATARVVRSIVHFTQAGGTIHVIVHGVNVGAQSYWNALATMLLHTRGLLAMTPEAALVLTGRAALEVSGSVAAEDEVAIGGFERVMGPNGEAHHLVRDLADAWRLLYRHYEYSYVVPGEAGPRRVASADPVARSVCESPWPEQEEGGFARVGDLFDAAHNAERKRPFGMRALLGAVVDQDRGHLERWRAMAGAETAIVWDARVGGFGATLIGIESRNLPREGHLPADGPATWSAGTLFPLSSKKVARALAAASGNRPVVVLANLSGFDGSPESMRKLQLEHGAEIARAVVNFRGPLLFVVVSRYHGGAYVVFSKQLNPQLRVAAVRGSFASVIGGGPAAAVIFRQEVRARALADPRVVALRGAPEYEPVLAAVLAEKQAETAAAFDAIHTAERALRVGSLDALIEPAAIRPWIVAELEAALG